MSSDVGVIAQELKTAIPDAVIETGDLELKNGQTIKNFLHVDKSRVYMECVGAVIELGKKTENLDDRIEKLENIVVQDELNDNLDKKVENIITEKPVKDMETNIINEKKLDDTGFFNTFKSYKKAFSKSTVDSKASKYIKCSPMVIKLFLGLTMFAISLGLVNR